MQGILKGLLLLCVCSVARGDTYEFNQALIGETGEFYCGDSDYWTPENPGSDLIHFVQNITFNTPFTSQPVVFLTVTYLDNDKGSNVRFLTKYDNASERGFRALVFKWSNTKIYEMRVTWLAISGDYAEKTGEVDCGAYNNWTPALGNPKFPEVPGRQFAANVNFSPEFNNAPLLVLSVTFLDCDYLHNLRFLAQVDNVTSNGFRARCYTWADTSIWDMKINWLALPTYFHGETGEFYCGHSDNWAYGLGNPKYPERIGRRSVQNVTFPTPFIFKPVVFLSVTYLDNDRLSNLRFLAQVDDVSRDGFRAMCYTWEDTTINEMRVTWFAF